MILYSVAYFVTMAIVIVAVEKRKRYFDKYDIWREKEKTTYL
jgi:hypothetical protein